jgi:zinc D-Ala-D-Ala carboxypeptidase
MRLLSEHLSIAELTRSESAKRLGLSNMPTEEHLDNLKKLADNIFEPIRNHFRCPILISSGYRSQGLNNAIGGAKGSDHLKGMAIDIDMDNTPNGVTNKMIFDYIKNNLKFRQLIWEFGDNENPNWVHISYNENDLKNEILIATKHNGKTNYKKN